MLDSVSNEEQVIHIECNSVIKNPLSSSIESLNSGWRSAPSASGVTIFGRWSGFHPHGLAGCEFVMGLIDNTGDSDMTREVMIEDAAQLFATPQYESYTRSVS